MTLNVIILQSRDCGVEVFRLLVWQDGKLTLVQTRMSREGAMDAWALYCRKMTAKIASLQLKEIAA